MNIPKMCLKQLFSHSVDFSGDFVFDCPFKLRLTGQTLTPLLYLTVSNFVVFFRLLDSKFNEDSKSMPKTVIFSL